MTDSDMVPAPGGGLIPADMADEFADLAQTGEELGSTLLDMLAVYSNDHGRWKTGDTRKDSITGILLHSFTHMRSFWPPEAPMGDDPPTCWSFGGKEAVPSPDSPEAQNETCEGCPWDEFGTAKEGKGKGCKTKRVDFIVEVDEEKLVRKDGKLYLDEDAVLGLALLRSSATAAVTRKSLGAWAKEVQVEAGGVAPLVLTKWSFADTKSSGGTAFHAPILECLGKYEAERDALEEVLQTTKDLRGGQAEEIITTLAGKAGSYEDDE